MLFLYIYSFLLRVFLIASLHLSFGLPIFRCPPTPTFRFLITTSSPVSLSTWSKHLSLPYLIFSMIFSTSALALISSFLIFSFIFIPAIHLYILSSVLFNTFCSNVLSAHVSLPYIRVGLMTVLYTAAAVLSIVGILLSHFPHPAPIRGPTSSSRPPFPLLIGPRIDSDDTILRTWVDCTSV